MEPCDKCEVCNHLCEIVPQMASAFKALGDLTRLRIIYLLSTDTSGKLGVSELADRLEISQPAVSQHLKTLKSEGLVDSRREGLYIYYTVNRDRMVEFREHFELMYASIMEQCNREMIRRTSRDREIRACIIFYSYSGVTRGIAETFRNVTGCDLVEVKPVKAYTWRNLFPTGIVRARNLACDPIEPSEIDVSGYDLLIVGTPVWVGRPTPPINCAVKALRGCEGKMAVPFITYLNQPGDALAILSRELADRGVRIMAGIALDEKVTKNPDAGGELLRRILRDVPNEALAEKPAGSKEELDRT
jgi:DNA-binding transcriptional ArsR family regulator